MEYPTDSKETQIKMLQSQLKIFSMFKMRFCYDKENVEVNVVENIAIRCNNCGKETGLSMKNVNNNYKEIITNFLLNTMLYHVGMSQIIEATKKLKYNIEKNNPDWITGGPWYNTSICKNLHGTVLGKYIINVRTDRYNLTCYIDAHEKHQS